jgi:hypothetical protein
MRRFAQFLLVVLLISHTGFACTRIYPTFTVSPNFKVKVVSPGKGGIRLELISKSSRFASTTGEDGYAAFNGIPVGEYEIATVQRSQGLNDFAYVVVAPSSGESDRVVLNYPTNEVLFGSTLSGRLLYYAKSKPLQVTAVEQPTGRVIDSVTTGKDGSFLLKGANSDVFYTLEITDESHAPEERMLGAIPIVISKRKQLPLDLSISFSTCGLDYARNGDCGGLAVVKAPAACFSVIDSSGAVIANTRVQLTSLSSQSLQFAGVTSASGELDIRDVVRGDYRVRFDAAGFPPAERLIYFEGKSCSKRIQTEMALSLCTGKMSLEKANASSY